MAGPIRRFRQPLLATRLGALVALALAVGSGAAAARCIPVAGLDKPGDGVSLARLGGPGHNSGRILHLAQAAGKGAKSGDAMKSRGPALPPGHIEITFLGHSSFLLRTHKNATAITDYNGYLRAPYAPDIVTMNRAHNTHFTLNVEPGVKHILRGWPEKGKIPRHDVRVNDLRVTNVPTNIRDGGNGDYGVAGNSIFIFESAGLCVVHLGHLHHMLRPSHAGRVGSVDILLAPIDDAWTMSHADLVKVIDRLQPVVVIPMHFGSGDTLARFLALMKPRKYAVKMAKGKSARFMKATLPVPTVLVLKGGWY